MGQRGRVSQGLALAVEEQVRLEATDQTSDDLGGVGGRVLPEDGA